MPHCTITSNAEPLDYLFIYLFILVIFLSEDQRVAESFWSVDWYYWDHLGIFFFLFLFNALGSISSDSNSVGQKKDKGSPFLEWESLSFILEGDHGPW